MQIVNPLPEDPGDLPWAASLNRALARLWQIREIPDGLPGNPRHLLALGPVRKLRGEEKRDLVEEFPGRRFCERLLFLLHRTDLEPSRAVGFVELDSSPPHELVYFGQAPPNKGFGVRAGDRYAEAVADVIAAAERLARPAGSPPGAYTYQLLRVERLYSEVLLLNPDRLLFRAADLEDKISSSFVLSLGSPFDFSAEAAPLPEARGLVPWPKYFERLG